MNKIGWISALLGDGLVFLSSCSEQKDGFVTIYPTGGQAKVIRLQVVNDQIIRVQATFEEAEPHHCASECIYRLSSTAR